MTMISVSAPGKIILVGEHAVVYGQPALAVPVTHVYATATLLPGAAGIWLETAEKRYALDDAPADDVLAKSVRLAMDYCARHYPRQRQTSLFPAFTVTLNSTIPLGSGLGSGAAVCTAIVRAVATYRHANLAPHEVSNLVYETEKMLHGTPSGIDNTVVAYAQPVWFIRGLPPEPLTVRQLCWLLIGDTGIYSPTKDTVADVRAAWSRNQEHYSKLFSAVGGVAREAREILEKTDPNLLPRLGELLDRNHELLREIGVSSPELDNLVHAAREAGALGAKLSGGGRGGNMLALVTAKTAGPVRQALEAAGAKRVLETVVGVTEE